VMEQQRGGVTVRFGWQLYCLYLALACNSEQQNDAIPEAHNMVHVAVGPDIVWHMKPSRNGNVYIVWIIQNRFNIKRIVVKA
jgi:hypothetical protein